VELNNRYFQYTTGQIIALKHFYFNRLSKKVETDIMNYIIVITIYNIIRTACYLT